MKQTTETVRAATVRIDRRTGALARRLKPGEIAVIDHADLDRDTASALVRAKPSAVLNAARTVTGRYPALGARVIVAAGVTLIDDLGPDVMSLAEGSRVSLDGAAVLRGEHVLAEGTLHTADTVSAALEGANAGLDVKLASFTANAMGFVRRERDVLLSNDSVPETRTTFTGRHALVVQPSPDAKKDLTALRSYIKQMRPVLVGVDSGADALLEAGFIPDVIVGDMSSLSAKAAESKAEFVVRAARDGRAPGSDALDRKGVPYSTFTVDATSADAALLLAAARGADVIVTSGQPADLTTFLDAAGNEAASSFLTRLKVGAKLVDASTAARLYRNQISGWYIFWLILAALVALAVAIAVTPAGQSLLAQIPAFSSISAWFASVFG